MIRYKRKIFITFILLFTGLDSLKLIGQTRDLATEYKYESELKQIDSTLVNIFKNGTFAMDQNNFKVADSLYSIVYLRAPNFVPAIRRLGSIRYSLGEEKDGLRLVEKALDKDKSSANILTLSTLLMSTKVDDEKKQFNNFNRALKLLNEGQSLKDADEFEYQVLIAQVSLQLYQDEIFKKATEILINKHGEKMQTHYFAAILATQQESWIKAEDEILLAKSLGMNENDAQIFLDSGVHNNVLIEYTKKILLWGFIFWASGFLLLYIIGIILSNYTLKAIEKEFKTKSNSKLAHSLRGVYRFLINTAGIYYYISLPIILTLVIILTGGIIYMFLLLGHIPIQLALILLFGGCVTIYSMIRTLLTKVKYEDPGIVLKKLDAPALYELTNEVAKKLGTRRIDEIRITPETDLAVYEVGNWREKLNDTSKRILILGIGVIKDFKQSDFKAVIAHEYGHFSNRDTAGGAVALRVRNDMMKYYYALLNAGQAVWWNLAFQFIRLYDFVFRRISNGSTRLQEILADRVAAQNYGSVAFENGLTYVIKRNIEFMKLAKNEIEDAKKSERIFNNLYELTNTVNEEIEKEVKSAMNRETTNEDTHPSPVDRFRFIKGLGNDELNSDNKYVRDLFLNWKTITLEMTKKVQDNWS